MRIRLLFQSAAVVIFFSIFRTQTFGCERRGNYISQCKAIPAVALPILKTSVLARRTPITYGKRTASAIEIQNPNRKPDYNKILGNGQINQAHFRNSTDFFQNIISRENKVEKSPLLPEKVGSSKSLFVQSFNKPNINISIEDSDPELDLSLGLIPFKNVTQSRKDQPNALLNPSIKQRTQETSPGHEIWEMPEPADNLQNQTNIFTKTEAIYNETLPAIVNKLLPNSVSTHKKRKQIPASYEFLDIRNIPDGQAIFYKPEYSSLPKLEISSSAYKKIYDSH